MDWAEIDSLLWLAVVLALIFWGSKALVGWLGAQGLLSDDVTHGIISFIP